MTHRHKDGSGRWTTYASDPEVAAETATRASADTALGGQIASEASARSAADSALAGQIAALTARVAALEAHPAPAPSLAVGSAFADTLANTVVGGQSLNAVSHRFRASGAQLVAVRGYQIGGTHQGYGAGTGGTWAVTVEEDDGSGMPSGRVVGSATVVHPADGFPLTAIPAALKPGGLYHVVYRNADADPVSNYSSVDDLYLRTPTSPRQPTVPDSDWATCLKTGSGPWAERPGFSPILDLAYADGSHQGLGYMEVWVRSPRTVGGTAMARELFPAPVTARSASLRVVRVSGSSPLTVTLGSQSASVPASAVATQPSLGQDGCSASLVTVTFPAPATGTALLLSAPADTAYAVFAVRKGSEYAFGPSTYAASKGQVSADGGATWGPFTQDGGPALDEGDVQFGLTP